MSDITLDLIRKLPKTDLHVHLDGSLRLETILNLADRYSIRLPANDLEGLKKAIVVDENCRSLVDYLRAFDVTLKVLQTDEALEQAAYELAEDAARENVRYIEVRFAPILHTNNHMSLEQIIDSVVQGLKRAEKNFNIMTGLIITGMRHFSTETSLISKSIQDRLSTFTEKELTELLALETAKVAVKMARKEPKIVGFDLAGAENGSPAKDFYRAFHEVISGHLSITAHAGEAYGPESIEQAVKYCHAHRIGHGTRLIEDPHKDSVRSLYRYFRDHRIPLEICLTSNIQTCTVPSFKEHPIRKFFDDQLRFTICTDNRLISDIDASNEYYKLVTEYGFTRRELGRVLIYGFESIFLEYDKRKALTHQVKNEIKELLLKDEVKN